jgi:polar amino acid transport system substrate-binding protein
MHKLKKIIPLVLLLLLVMPFAAVLADGHLPDLGGRTVTVAVENAYMPFNVIDEETGEAVGWDYDTLGLICELVNCVPEFVETSWEGMIVAVSSGEYDMSANGITITEDRAEIVDYSMGYIDLSQKFMVRVGEDRFANAEEFVAGDFIIGVQVATTNFEAASGLVSEDRIVAYSEFGFAVQALISGDVDGVVIDDVAGQGYTGLNADKIKLLPDELTKEQLGYIYPQGSD